MSEQLTPEHLEQAAACLGTEVMAPAFFAKLASYGITPSNEAECEQLLELGIKLGAAAQQGIISPEDIAPKTAGAEENSFLKAANDLVDETLQSAPVSPEQRDAAIAQYVQNDDVVKTAALVLAAAAAETAQPADAPQQ